MGGVWFPHSQGPHFGQRTGGSASWGPLTCSFPLLMLYGFLAQPFSLSTGRLVFKIFVQKYHFKLKAGYFVLGGVDLFPHGSRCDKIPEDDG